MPTITLRYPSNIPGTTGHHWASAIAMATPIAHKGARAGAKVQAMTMIDLLTQPKIVPTRGSTSTRADEGHKYTPLIRPEDQPATDLNTKILAKYREEMKKYYFDPTKIQERIWSSWACPIRRRRSPPGSRGTCVCLPSTSLGRKLRRARTRGWCEAGPD